MEERTVVVQDIKQNNESISTGETTLDENIYVENNPDIYSNESSTDSGTHHVTTSNTTDLECTEPTTNNLPSDSEISAAKYHIGDDIDADILKSVLKAFNLAKEMGALQKNFMDIVMFERDLYYQGIIDKVNRWPKNYSTCMQVLWNAGYTNPVTYHVCLNKHIQSLCVWFCAKLHFA